MLETTTLIAAVAVALQIVGFLLRDQVSLRLLVLAGSGFYVLYYLIAAERPLWDAIVGTSAIAAANLFGLVALLLSRARFSVPEAQRDLLDALRPLEPGLFRRLMRVGELVQADAARPMTEEGVAPDALWFVAEGRIGIDKFGESVEIEGPCFIGEIAWLQGVPATATTRLLPGARAVRWPRDPLRRITRRSPRLATALEALIAQDMARKVALGRPKVAPAAARGVLGGVEAAEGAA
ncbi:MAG: cyclic nucleotide-binding domain-containing protein [Paracoccaceae bacterium]